VTPFDPLLALRVLHRHDVRFVLIGGFAAGVMGAPLNTNDLDICHERTTLNLDRLAAALVELGARLRVAHVDEDLPCLLDSRTLAAGDSFTCQTDAGDVDVLGTPSGTGGFRDLDAAASTYDLGGGLLVRVCSLDDLIRMKEAAHRLKDEAHLHVLTVLRDMQAQADPPSWQ
jgi:hypothetical protein